METGIGVGLAILAGVVLWGVPRMAAPIPPMGIRIFWIAVVAALMGTIKLPQPYNIGAMGLLAGMAAFENLYQRHMVRAQARKEEKAAKEKAEREARRAKKRERTKRPPSEQPPPDGPNP